MNMPLDSESRIHDDHHLALKLWLRLLTCSNLVEAELRRKLRLSHNSTLPRFDLMAQLDRQPEKLTMGELSDRMMVSGGNVTGLVRQMEKEGLISRVPRKSDRRTWLVGLTPRGKRLFRQMADEHERWVIDLFADMDKQQQEALFAALLSLKSSIRNRTSGNDQ